jgi:hypothetical protein
MLPQKMEVKNVVDLHPLSNCGGYHRPILRHESS